MAFLELGEDGIALVALGIPLIREAARGDVIGEPFHRGAHVEMVELAPTRQLAVLAGRRVVLGLDGEAFLSEQPVGSLDLAREHQLGDDRLHRDAPIDHGADEGLVDRGERRGQHLLDTEVEDRLLFEGQLDRTLTEPADRERDGQYALERASRLIVLDTDCGDEPVALHVTRTHLGPEHARGDHPEVARRVEPSERGAVAAGDDRACVGPGREAERWDHVVGDEHTDHVGVVRGRDLGGVEPVVAGLFG